MIKLIAIDLDGTLLNSEGEVGEENQKALSYAKSKGAEVVLASGRITSSVKEIAKSITTGKYLISGNGAVVYQISENQAIYENFIDKKKILELVKLCEENSIFYSIHTEDMILTKALLYDVAFYQYENSKKNNEKKININVVQDIYSYIQESSKNKFFKMTICDKDKIVFSSIIRKLANIPDIDVLQVEHTSSKVIRAGTEEITIDYFYTEVTKAEVDKWNAIQEIMKREQIQREEVMVIGDNANDKKMIQNAGIGVAMGQSAPEVKEVADFVSSHYDEHGVAVAIRKFI